VSYDRYFDQPCPTCGRLFPAATLGAHVETRHPVTEPAEAPHARPLVSWMAWRYAFAAAPIIQPYQAAFLKYLDAPLPVPKATKGLRDAVAEQIAALTADLDGFAGGEELPRPPADLTNYVEAFASAAKNCRHPNATDVLYGREWSCPDCHRVVGRDEMGGRWE
jgi:hypothetical protein